MIELNKSIYMNEDSLLMYSNAYKVGNIIQGIYNTLLNH